MNWTGIMVAPSALLRKRAAPGSWATPGEPRIGSIDWPMLVQSSLAVHQRGAAKGWLA